MTAAIKSITVQIDFEVLRTTSGEIVGNPCIDVEVSVTGEYAPSQAINHDAPGIRVNAVRYMRGWPLAFCEFDATAHAVDTAVIEQAVRKAVEGLFKHDN